MDRIRVGVLMGGASAEREISLASGKMVADNLPKDKYDVVMLDTLALMAHNPNLPEALRRQARQVGRSGAAAARSRHALLLPEGVREGIRKAAGAVAPATGIVSGESRVQVVFIALHGPYGEDGTLQGMLELLGIPFVGSGTLASALAMDKVMAKKVFRADCLPTPADCVVERAAFAAAPQREIERVPSSLLPAVVKPVRQGSSIGITMVDRPEDLRAALESAFEYDSRALVEERVSGRELTAGVLGNHRLTALPVVEIVPKRDFFDYQAKYDAECSEEICPAAIPPEVASEAQSLAIRAHRSLGCRGLSRTDLIWGPRGLTILEVNTVPGLTENSLIPKAARAAGISFPELLDRLVQLALETT